MKTLLETPGTGVGISEERATALINQGPTGLLDMMAAARLAMWGGATKPFNCAIVNAKSGRCRENCRFCAQSIHHRTDAPVHPLLSADELTRRAERIADAGMNYCGFVMSGTAPAGDEFDGLCETAARIVSRVPIKLCASLGVLDEEQAVRLRQAGFTSCHHNIETAPSFYAEACPSHDYSRRAQTVRNARAAGLRVCSGGLFGLGESWRHRLELSRTLAELDVDSIPVNFLTAVSGTPMENTPPLPPNEALAIIAVLRLMHPTRDIVVCGGRGGALGRFETLMFSAGANGLLMGDYLTTRGGAPDSDRELLRVLGIRAR